jgi:methyl-CpG-binding domain protein 4
LIKSGWIPPRSPYGLIQEDIFPDEWLILVSCVMLNQTSRKQVERVLPEFRRRWPTPDALLEAPINDVTEVLRPLGFCNRRTKNLYLLSGCFLAEPWQHARELPGIGEYGARAWEIFCRGEIGNTPPKDHALTDYWRWYIQHWPV